MTTLYELPMKYMFGLKVTDTAANAETTKAILQGSDGVTDKVFDTLADLLAVILEIKDYNDFDRSVVQLTCRLISCS